MEAKITEMKRLEDEAEKLHVEGWALCEAGNKLMGIYDYAGADPLHEEGFRLRGLAADKAKQAYAIRMELIAP